MINIARSVFQHAGDEAAATMDRIATELASVVQRLLHYSPLEQFQ